MATDPKERKEQERPREASPEQTPAKQGDNTDQAKEGMPGYGQPPPETRRPLPDQDW